MCYHGGSYINLPELGGVPVTYAQLFNVGDLVTYRYRLNNEYTICGLIIKAVKTGNVYSSCYTVLWSQTRMKRTRTRSYNEYEMQKNIEKCY